MHKRIADNLSRVRDRIAEACINARRDPADVRVVVVTKSVDIPVIQAAVQCGVTDLGENRVQQFVRRAPMINEFVARGRDRTAGRSAKTPEEIRWHMIGTLQRNKVNQILPHTQLIHAIDSVRLAEHIDKAARNAGIVMHGLLQVNASEEDQKHGLPPGAATYVVEQLANLSNLRIVGLMTMAAQSDDAEKARPVFARLREIFEDTVRGGYATSDFVHLSMGMSADYVAAVREGATIVRIGSAVFEGVE